MIAHFYALCLVGMGGYISRNYEIRPSPESDTCVFVKGSEKRCLLQTYVDDEDRCNAYVEEALEDLATLNTTLEAYERAEPGSEAALLRARKLLLRKNSRVIRQTRRALTCEEKGGAGQVTADCVSELGKAQKQSKSECSDRLDEKVTALNATWELRLDEKATKLCEEKLFREKQSCQSQLGAAQHNMELECTLRVIRMMNGDSSQVEDGLRESLEGCLSQNSSSPGASEEHGAKDPGKCAGEREDQASSCDCDELDDFRVSVENLEAEVKELNITLEEKEKELGDLREEHAALNASRGDSLPEKDSFTDERCDCTDDDSSDKLELGAASLNLTLQAKEKELSELWEMHNETKAECLAEKVRERASREQCDLDLESSELEVARLEDRVSRLEENNTACLEKASQVRADEPAGAETTTATETESDTPGPDAEESVSVLTEAPETTGPSSPATPPAEEIEPTDPTPNATLSLSTPFDMDPGAAFEFSLSFEVLYAALAGAAVLVCCLLVALLRARLKQRTLEDRIWILLDARSADTGRDADSIRRDLLMLHKDQVRDLRANGSLWARLRRSLCCRPLDRGTLLFTQGRPAWWTPPRKQREAPVEQAVQHLSRDNPFLSEIVTDRQHRDTGARPKASSKPELPSDAAEALSQTDRVLFKKSRASRLRGLLQKPRAKDGTELMSLGSYKPASNKE